jgi:flagellar hook-length control protein FliK
MHDAVNVVNLSPPVVTAPSKPAASAAPPSDEFSFDAVLKQASDRIQVQKEDEPKKSRDEDINVQAAVQAVNGKPQPMTGTKKTEITKAGAIKKEGVDQKEPSTEEGEVQSEVVVAQAVIMQTLVVVENITEVNDAEGMQGETAAASMVIDLRAKSIENESTPAEIPAEFATEPALTNKETQIDPNLAKSATETPTEAHVDIQAKSVTVDQPTPKTFDQPTPKTVDQPTPKTIDQPTSDTHRVKESLGTDTVNVNLEGKNISQLVQGEAAQQPVNTVESTTQVKAAEKMEIKVESTAENPPPETPPVAEGIPINASNTTSQVHEPARLAEAPRNEVISQVSTQLGQMVKTNQTSFRMQLYPEELGHIDLRIVTTKTGLAVSMVADSVTTQVALKSEMSHLKQTIEQAGIQISNLHIGHQQTSNGQQTFEGKNNEQKPVYHSNLPFSVANVVNTKVVSLQESTIDFRA